MKGNVLILAALLATSMSVKGPVSQVFATSSLTFGTTTYFQNLTKYSPYNLEGSCSYVSLSMMLAYYDNFRNDNIILGQYERHDEFTNESEALLVSPGTEKTAPISYSKNYAQLIGNIEEYYRNLTGDEETKLFEQDSGWIELQRQRSNELWDYVHMLSDTDFQMKLISTAADTFEWFSRDVFSTGGSHTWWQQILNSVYGEGSVTFTSFDRDNPQDYIDYGYESLAELAEAKLDEGYVLHVAINSLIDDSGHGVTAYYHDEDGIHAHWGWGASRNDCVIDFKEYEISVVGWLDFPGFPLEHSQNYVIDGVGYCGCGEHAIHSYEEFYGPGTYSLPLGGFSISRAGIGFPGGIVDPGKEPPDIPERPKIIVPNNSHLAVCPCGHYELQRHYTFEGTGQLIDSSCSACGHQYSPLLLVPEEIDI